MSDWIEWAGGSESGPDLPSDAVVEVKWRDGDTAVASDPSDRPFWAHGFGRADIVAYRLVNKEPA